ncbi:hypothetical protein BCIN_12g04950 [Botrytis cinerea B05.10]|uniref:Zn(2)-C6 fungal-type domain-containing protein n=1 Tax=Botryotinia fuckeliana (strain B05.10) TaxID=332648 RepID=A0A384JZK9_BOTFB|nr:hypothetical protein BCIN_12g04950 [Botrytis cinerea B05.10]ATZ55951.1 hypothetical protein BCIN_12g04950 [Botrytis cinerea B05.10]
MEDTRFDSSRKRPRPVVSCLRCREKKLKCDRLLPCQNCTKIPNGSAECTYNHDPTKSISKSRPTTHSPGDRTPDLKFTPSVGNNSNVIQGNGGVGVVEELQSRVARLEELLQVTGKLSNIQKLSSQPSQPSQPSPTHKVSKRTNAPSRLIPGLCTLIVKGSRSRYHGQNDRITLLNQFPEAKDFINKSATSNTSIINLAKDVQYLQQKSQSHFRMRKETLSQESAAVLSKLREFLPGKPVCDRLLKIYTDNFEKSSRILHVPSFLRLYSHFWTSPDDKIFQSSPFLPQLTAILAICYKFLDSDSGFDDDQKTYLEMASLELVAAWTDTLSRKQAIDISTLQTETLLLLARQLQLISSDKLWCATGALVRSAMVMGLHLRPADFKKISPFHAELRRRLWATIVQMDLQASMAASMPSIVPDIDFSQLAPANLNDADFDESSTELPPSRPLYEWTDSLAQVTLAMSLAQQLKVVSLIRDISPEMDLTEVVREGRKLEELLRRVPVPLKLDGTLQRSPSHLLDCVLLDIYLRRPFLNLYRLFLWDERQDDPLFREMQQICLESSVAIVSYQDYFDPSVADLDLLSTNLHWTMFQICCKNDVLAAVLSICQYIKASASGSQSNEPSPGFTPNQFSTTLPSPPATNTHFSKARLTRIVEGTLEGFTKRVGEFGSDLKDVLMISVAMQSVRATGTSNLKESLMHEGAKKALSTCRQTLLQSFPGEEMKLPSNNPEVNEDSKNNIRVTPAVDIPMSTVDQAIYTSQPGFVDQLATFSADVNQFQGDIFDFSDAGIFNVDNDWSYNEFWQ